MNLTDAQGNSLAPASRPDGSPNGLHPNEIQAAYNIATWGGLGLTVAIVDAFDNPNAEADLQVYRTQFGLGACTTENGCFRKVNQNGNASPLPPGDAGWGLEIALDLDAVSAACPGCKLLLVEANTNSMSNLLAAERTAVNLGATIVSSPSGTLFLHPPDPSAVVGGGVTGDFDGDGKDDVMVLHDNGNASAALWVFPGTAGQTDGSTAPYRVWFAPGPNAFDANRAKVTAGDFDGDGKTDVLALYDYGDTSAALFVFPGVASHAENASVPYKVWSVQGPNAFDVGRAKISAADFNGDGKTDLLALYDYGNTSAGLFVFPGVASHSENASLPYLIWFVPGPNAFDVRRAKVSAGDFDGDGKGDLLALYDYGNTSAGLFVFPGVTSKTQNASQPYRIWFVPGPNAFDVSRAKVSAGDFNGDQKADLLALYDYGNTSAGLFVFPGVASHVENASQPSRVWHYGSGSAGLFVFPGTTGTTDTSSVPYRVWNPGPGSFDLRFARVP